MSGRDGIQRCSTGQYEETEKFLDIEVFKPILVVTQNEMMDFKISMIFFFHYHE